MNLGGPVWHASVASADPAYSETRAKLALNGVGDARLGEWIERTPKAVHVRRRLSEHEQLVIGEARDIRGSEEVSERLKALFAEAPHLKRFAVAIGELVV